MHFTQNPIGSDDQLDLQDNAISFDYAMNSPAALWTDRFGKQHKTVQQALKDVGFKPAGFDFVSGGTLGIGDRDKCVFYPTDGYWYSWNGKLPYVVPANSSPTPGGKKGWGVGGMLSKVGLLSTTSLTPPASSTGSILHNAKITTTSTYLMPEGIVGVFFQIHKVGSGNITINLRPGDTFDDGTTTKTITSSGMKYIVCYAANKWYLV